VIFGPFPDAKETSQISHVVGGSVYAIEVDGIVKIGCSRTPANRIFSLSKLFRREGKSFGGYICSHSVNDHKGLERCVHSNLSHLKIVGNGELFRASLNEASAAISEAISGRFRLIENEIPEWVDAYNALTPAEKVQLAKRIGVTLRTVQNWAAGTCSPSRMAAKKIPAAFKRMGGRA
jgi:DNA-binding XRE family transcriptional regulator